MAKKKYSRLVVRGFLRGQLVESKTGKIMGDTGWIENKLMDDGLIDLARLVGAVSGSYVVGFACMATQTDPPNGTQTHVIGPINSFKALNLSTSGTCTLTCTASFGSASLTAQATVGAAGLFKTDSGSSMFAMQTFTPSTWATNQDFNLTYQIRFATA